MKKIIVPLLMFSLVVCSCHTPRYIYSPSPPNNPCFMEKGDSRLAAYLSTGGGGDDGVSPENSRNARNSGFDIQAAYAAGKNWALLTSYFHRKERDIYSESFNFFDSSVVNYKRNLLEFGGGYFVPLNTSRSILFNIYGGLGLGKFSFTDFGIDNQGADYSRSHTSKVTKWFFQPALNFIPGRYFRISLVGKFSFIRYGDISTSYTTEELKYFDLDMIAGRTFEFFEPTFNMQVGIPECDWLKIDGGFTFSTDPFHKALNVEARNFNASIGLNFDLTRLKKNKHHQ